MNDAKQMSAQLFSIIPVVFAAVLGVLVGTQLSLVDKINRLEERSERMAVALSYERTQAQATPVSCTIGQDKSM